MISNALEIFETEVKSSVLVMKWQSLRCHISSVVCDFTVILSKGTLRSGTLYKTYLCKFDLLHDTIRGLLFERS